MSPTGSPLSRTAIEAVIRRLPDGSKATGKARLGRLVLPDNIDAIRNHCSIDQSKCWIAPGAGPAACRAAGSGRPDDELPTMATHRWVWMVINDCSSDPLPAAYHVRRRCKNNACCSPHHLYLTTPQGEELTVDEARRQLRRETNSPDHDKSRRANPHFAARLNKLFDTHLDPNGDPYTSEQVSAALQEDGLPISGTLLERLRSGRGDPPKTQTAEALAYFFNVDVEYFFAGEHSALVSEATRTDVAQTPPADPTPSAGSDTTIGIPTFVLGQTVKGLSETISDRLARGGTEDRLAINLVEILAEIGDSIATWGDARTINQALLQRLVDEWHAAARREEHQVIIARLQQRLLNG